MKKNTFVYVKTTFEGMHYWANAPEEVKFLRNPHRHLFYVTAMFQVDHPDRELEFFILQRKLNELVKYYTYKPGIEESIRPLSCEQFADLFFQYFCNTKYNIVSVDVSEDNENGARVMKRKE